MSVDRRSLIGAAAALALAPTEALAVQRKRPPLGIQLYTLMKLLETDLEGTIAKVAAMGYREVETLGALGRDAKELRQILDRNGLTSPSQHIMTPGVYKIFKAIAAGQMDFATFEREFIAAFSYDQIDALIESAANEAKILGQKYIVWQLSWPSQLASTAKIDELLKTINRAADLCHAKGFMLGYHNHSQEFTKVGNDVPYDLLLKGTDPKRVTFELDLAWAATAKVDPLAYFANHPGRFRMVHMKDVGADGKIRDPGTGIVPFKRIIPAAEKAGIEHFYVEYDGPTDPLATAKHAYDYLAPLL